MKKVLILAVMLSIMLFSYGTSHAVLGVADDVSGTDILIPFICGKDATNGLDTLWAVAEVWDFAATADLVVYDRRSNPIFDDIIDWTESDIVADSCKHLITLMSPVQQAALERTIGGKTYYIGYVAYYNWNWPDWDQFISWVYLVDLSKGFAAGFNGFSAEGYLGSDLGEYDSFFAVEVDVTAWTLFPRYYLHNSNAETWNWWITLHGTNSGTDAAPTRWLSGWICNEAEYCISLDIPIPNELNIIDVASYLPAALHAGFPKAGMGWFFLNPYEPGSSTYGWSYQRAGDAAALSWSAIHPMHRWY